METSKQRGLRWKGRETTEALIVVTPPLRRDLFGGAGAERSSGETSRRAWPHFRHEVSDFASKTKHTGTYLKLQICHDQAHRDGHIIAALISTPVQSYGDSAGSIE